MDLNKVLKNITDEYYDFGYFKFPRIKEREEELHWLITCEFINIFWKKYPHLITIEESGESPYELGKICLNKDDVVIDCGANIGLFSILASLKGCITYAIEPDKKTCAIMEQVKILNNMDFKIFQLALSDKNEEKDFYIHPDNCAVATFKRNIVNKNPKPETFLTEKIQCQTLDNFVYGNKIKKIDFIKVDIEGSEKEMLKGAKQTLKEFSPMLSIAAYHYDDDIKEITKLIKDINKNYIVSHTDNKIYAWLDNE